MPVLGIYSWSQFTIPAGIPTGNLTGDSHANDPDPANPIYDAGNPVTWIGETFTFNGGSPTQIEITDDDGVFEDAYVETGAAQTLTTGITIDGTFFPAGSSVQNEFALIDASGQEIYIVAINGQNVGFTYANGEEPTATDTFTATSSLDGAPTDNADGISSSSEPYADIICFAAGTRIATPGGPVRVEDLARGDLLSTLDHGPQPILWVGSTKVALRPQQENTKPVRIAKGSLGGLVPARDLIVSQQHCMLLRGPEVEAMFGHAEVLAPAKGLLSLRGVRVMHGKREVLYVHLLVPRHAVILAEGAPSESFYPGPAALTMMQPDQRAAVLGALPKGGYGPKARRCLRVRETRDLVSVLQGDRATA